MRVREVPPGESLRPFIDLAWIINAGDPNWVAPLRMTVETVLDRRKHPYHRHADTAYFLAERGGRVVGRIAATVNHLYNEFQSEKTGFFGFFESVDDPEVASALLDAAAAWLRARGMERMRGPMNFSTNEESSSPGVLVEGFDTPPKAMMSHNPRYYGALMDAAGMEKSKDLLAYHIGGPEIPQRLVTAMERLAGRLGVRIRSLRMKELDAEVKRIQEIYNSAWSQNWGFVPMTDAEFEHIAKDMKPIVDPDLCFIAETESGEPVGFSLALPDIHQVQRHIPDGKLFPFGIFKFLWYKRKINSVRVITLGFKPGYQHQGIGAVFYLRTFQVGPQKGYGTAEASWILEDNWDMRRPLEKMGAVPYKRYRIYDREL